MKLYEMKTSRVDDIRLIEYVLMLSRIKLFVWLACAPSICYWLLLARGCVCQL